MQTTSYLRPTYEYVISDRVRGCHGRCRSITHICPIHIQIQEGANMGCYRKGAILPLRRFRPARRSAVFSSVTNCIDLASLAALVTV